MNPPHSPMRCWLWSGSGWTCSKEVPVSDRGFRYGMAVFETLRIRAGAPEHLEAHRLRLERAARTCGFPLEAEGLDALEALGVLVRSGLAESGVARLYLTAGDGGPADPVTAPRMLLLVEERPLPTPSHYVLRTCPKVHLPPFGGLKTANYWANAESLRAARAAGAQEALLFSPEGFLIGACMANVFLRREGGWFTPALECGARDGVMRAQVLARLPVQETRLTRAACAAAEAVLLTNSWIGVAPARELDGRKLALPAEYTDLSAL